MLAHRPMTGRASRSCWAWRMGASSTNAAAVVLRALSRGRIRLDARAPEWDSRSGLRTGIVRLARRRTAARGPRFAICAAFALRGVIVGGGMGVLLMLFAFLLFVDAVVPLPGGTWNEAHDHFRRLQRQRRYRRRRLAPEPLEVLDDRAGWVPLAERHDLGVLEIPLESVCGTVEEIKAARFDRDFRPDRSAAEHWDAAMARADPRRGAAADLRLPRRRPPLRARRASSRVRGARPGRGDDRGGGRRAAAAPLTLRPAWRSRSPARARRAAGRSRRRP